MESNEFYLPEGQKATAMELSPQSVIYLNETRKWTIFLSILGFISLGLLFITLVLIEVITGLLFLALGSFQFFPIYYLYKFSVLSKKAIYNHQPDDLTNAFRHLKSHYKFMGVLTIVILGLSLFSVIVNGLYSL